jgi:purine-binding chemotaxis protein CheW
MQKTTLYEKDFYEDKEVKEETIKLVVFRVSNEWYGVEISKSREVAKIEKITYLPSSPEHIAGIVNLRGDILSVTDLKRVFGLPQEQLTEKSRLVVIESGDLETGLLVDEVDEVMDAAVNKIHPTLATISAERADYLTGEYKMDNKLIGILNVEKILK